MLEQATGRPLPVEATLRKYIPCGAGLGGGSSDAAGMLIGLNRLFDLGLSRDALIAHASRLGSDVAFGVAALCDQPSAIAMGRGEQLNAAPLVRPLDLVLVLPPLSCPTGAVYGAFDAMRGDDVRVDQPRVRALAKQGVTEATSEQLFNDLAAPACQVTPALAEVRQRVAAVVDRPVHITGSGAAMFVLADDAPAAQQLAAQVQRTAQVVAVATRTRGV